MPIVPSSAPTFADLESRVGEVVASATAPQLDTPLAWLRSRRRLGRPSGTASTAQVTASSTGRCTRSSSRGSRTTPRREPMPSGGEPRAGPTGRSSAASNGSSRERSIASSSDQSRRLDRHRRLDNPSIRTSCHLRPRGRGGLPQSRPGTADHRTFASYPRGWAGPALIP